MLHTEIIQKIIDKKGYKSYLEIGLDRGLNWSQIQCARKLGCDPMVLIPAMKYGETVRYKNQIIHMKTSDDFFYYFGYGQPIDLVFIDGEHTFEQSLKDFNNAQKVLSDNGLIIMHDTMPTSEMESMIYQDFLTKYRDYQGAWMGDVWKTVYFLKQRKNNEYFTLDIPCGFSVFKKNKGDAQKPECDISKLAFKFFEENKKDVLNLKPMPYLGEFLNAR